MYTIFNCRKHKTQSGEYRAEICQSDAQGFPSTDRQVGKDNALRFDYHYALSFPIMLTNRTENIKV